MWFDDNNRVQAYELYDGYGIVLVHSTFEDGVDWACIYNGCDRDGTSMGTRAAEDFYAIYLGKNPARLNWGIKCGVVPPNLMGMGYSDTVDALVDLAEDKGRLIADSEWYDGADTDMWRDFHGDGDTESYAQAFLDSLNGEEYLAG